jgi:hypothetical protein
MPKKPKPLPPPKVFNVALANPKGKLIGYARLEITGIAVPKAMGDAIMRIIEHARAEATAYVASRPAPKRRKRRPAG